MLLKELMKAAVFFQCRLAVESGVPHATLSGLLVGNGRLSQQKRGRK